VDRPGPPRPFQAHHYEGAAPVTLSARREATWREAAGKSMLTRPVYTLRTCPPHPLTPYCVQNPEQLTSAINIVVSRASAEAISHIEALGGTVTTRFYSPTSIKRVLRGDSHPTVSLQSSSDLIRLASASHPTLLTSPILSSLQSPAAPEDAKKEAMAALMKQLGARYKYRLPDATARKDIEYYRDPAHRGYLAYTMKRGESPSLFFKPPGEAKDRKKQSARRDAAKASADNKLF
jgi:large subunit ribosomal protein L15